MVQTIKTGLRIGWTNWTTLLFFVITYKIIGFTLIIDLMEAMTMSILRILNIDLISQQNVVLLFHHPIAVLLLACMAVLFLYYVYLEIVASFLYCEAGWQGRHLSVWQLWKTAFFRSASFFRLKNIPALIALIPLFGLSVFPLTNGFMGKLQIPEFILDYITSSPKWLVLYLAARLVLNVLSFFYLFCLSDMIVQNKRYCGSLRSGFRQLKGNIFCTAAALFLCVLTFLLLAAVFSIAAVALLLGWSKLPPAADGGRSFFAFHLSRWGAIGSLIFSALLPVTLYAAVVALYHRYRGEQASPAGKIAQPPKRVFKRAAAVLASLILLMLFSETEWGGNLYHVYHPGTEVVAHRGGAAFAPENTRAALADSVEAGAEMAEIDVQQTRDGVLIVMHDSNFLRTAGLDQAVWETDFATVLTLDAGASFSRSFTGERIPTLAEMLAEAKGRIRLMLELKATGHEHGLVEETIRQIEAAGMERECVVASMDARLLQQSKELAPEIETVYITSILLSDQFDLDYVDGYSVETSFLTLEMVAQIHSMHKTVYAWTANSESNIKKIIRLGADGIVTDNPRLAKFHLRYFDRNEWVDGLSDVLYP